MSGSITVQAGGPSTVNVAIGDFFFAPANVVVGVGGQVVWTNNGPSQHSVVEQGGANLPSYCFNGRSFIGNTPTIVAHAGQRIRWYVFNLDLEHELAQLPPARAALALRRRDHRRAQHRSGRVVRRRDQGAAGAVAAAGAREGAASSPSAQAREAVPPARRLPGPLPRRDAHDEGARRRSCARTRRCG